ALWSACEPGLGGGSGNAKPTPITRTPSTITAPTRCFGERNGHPHNLRYTAARPRCVRIGITHLLGNGVQHHRRPPSRGKVGTPRWPGVQRPSPARAPNVPGRYRAPPVVERFPRPAV